MDGTTLSQFYDLLKIIPPSQPLLLVGDTGIGKTSIVRDVADRVYKMKMSYIPCMESTDMVDVTGMMDTSGNHTVYKPPKWYHEGEDVVVLMDEVNRNKAVMKGLMRLATDRKVGDAELTRNSYVFAAINPDDSGVYQVYEMDPAMLARFLVVYIKPTPSEWIDSYAIPNGVHPAIVNYVRSHPEDLDPFDNKDNLEKSKGSMYHNVLPARREWCNLSEVILRGEHFMLDDGTECNRFDTGQFPDGREFLASLVRGTVGVAVAERFVPVYYSSGSKAYTPEMFLDASDSDWSGKLPKLVARLCKEDPIAASTLGSDICKYLDVNELKLWNQSHTAPSLLAAKYSMNLYRFMYCCSAEIQANMFHSDMATVNLRTHKWPKLLGTAFAGLPDFLESKFGKKDK